MSIPMTATKEVRAFLDRELPGLIGTVATLRRDGSPHVVPVWYRYDGERVHIWTIDTRAWVKQLRRDPRVAFSVQEDREPFAAVLMRGTAQVVTGDDEGISAEIRRITRRYIEEPAVESYIANWLHLRTIVSITPTKLTAWGRGY
jgi:PPOX class probable F420-dependent enzyme